MSSLRGPADLLRVFAERAATAYEASKLGETVKEKIESAFEDRSLLEDEEHREAVFGTVAALDRGELRVAQREAGGEWR